MWASAAILGATASGHQTNLATLLADVRKNFGTLRHRPTARQGPELRVTRAASVLSPLESTLFALAEEHGEAEAGLLARTLIDPVRVFLVNKPTDHHVGFVLLSAFRTPDGPRLAILECEQSRAQSRDGQQLVNVRGRVVDALDGASVNAEIAAVYVRAEGPEGLIRPERPRLHVFGGDRAVERGVQGTAAAAGWRGEFFGRPESNLKQAKLAIARRPRCVALWEDALRHRPDVVETLRAESATRKADFLVFTGAAAADALRDLAAQLRTIELTATRFADVRSALVAAKEDFKDELDFLPEAETSASDSSFRRPDDIYAGLSHMAIVVRRWKADDLPSGFERAFAEVTAGYRSDISSTARGKYVGDYQRKLGDRDIVLGPHLSFGRGTPEYCARIYWWADSERRRFVVGHVGEHLRDDSW